MTSRLYAFIPSSGPSLLGMTLPRPSWVRLNRQLPLNNAQIGLGADAEQSSKRPITY